MNYITMKLSWCWHRARRV